MKVKVGSSLVFRDDGVISLELRDTCRFHDFSVSGMM